MPHAQEGLLLQTANDVHSPDTVLLCAGLGDGPSNDAALSNEPGYRNAVTGMGALLGTPPRRANAGNSWTRSGR